MPNSGRPKGPEPFKLEEEQYRFQLGEMAGGKTSITLFDKDKSLSHPASSPRCTSVCPRHSPRVWLTKLQNRIETGARALFCYARPAAAPVSPAARVSGELNPHRRGACAPVQLVHNRKCY